MRRSIRSRMILLIALPTFAVYVGILGISVSSIRRDARSELDENMQRLAMNYAARFDAAFRQAAAIAQTTAHFIEAVDAFSESQMFEQLRANVRADDIIYGAAMAFEPGTFKPGEELFCPYVHRFEGGLRNINITREVYDWHADAQWEWWHAAVQKNGPIWTAPYFDEGAGGALMVTHSVPFHRDGRLYGVTTVDIKISTLQERIGRQIVSNYDFVILTSDGRFVHSPDLSNVMGRTVFELAEDLGRPRIAQAGRHITSGDVGFATLPPFGDRFTQPQLMYFAPIASTGWGFATLLQEDTVLARLRQRMTMMAVALAVTLLAIIGLIVYVAHHITRPIEVLQSKVREISCGNLEARVEGVITQDEIGELAGSFNQMTEDLRRNLDKLATERGEREKLERDLDLARTIQRGLLPAKPPEAAGFDIAGWNRPADRTGGDYYDWLTLPDGRTVFTLADVTGHGIGPALIVAVCRAYMRASTSTGGVNLQQDLRQVNALLYEDTPANRFVTAAVGVLDPSRHEVQLLSAGQAPLLFYDAANNEVHEWVSDDVPLAVLDHVNFKAPRIIAFKPGDMLVLTTDGFFEWQNHSEEQFGTERLRQFVQDHHALSAQALIDKLYAVVLEHAAGAPQDDDLTALVIRRS